jgi:tRNA nucleotidyltransferase (CCA-adding enzyme)
MELLKKIIAKIKPHDTGIKKEIDAVLAKLNQTLKKNKAKAMVGGSFAKDTHLVDDHDCDIFVQFDQSYKDKNISDLLEKAVKQFKAQRVHGSRDYFQFSDKLNYEIVPVLKITKPQQALNVTDVSPLHVAWTKKHKKSDEIRLAKAFCKAQSIYGAESHIKGFSGHVLDILTIHYRSFINLLKASQKWKSKTVIDIEKHYKNADDALFGLNASKLQSPLIVVDPIQRERNAAAALSEEKLSIFVKAAQAFLKKPSEKFFEKNVLQKKDLKDAIILDIVPTEGKRDVVGAKIMKTHDALKRVLEDHGFEIQKSGWIWDKETFVWLKLKNEKISAEKIIEGPPLKFDQHAAIFKKKHRHVFEKKGRLYAKEKQDYTDARELLKNIIKTDEIKEKVRSIRF